MGATNAAIVLAARGIVERRRAPLHAYAQVPDHELATALRARRIGVPGDRLLRLEFFAGVDIAARVLLDTHPVPAPECGVLVVGSGPFVSALLDRLAGHDGEVTRDVVPGAVDVGIAYVCLEDPDAALHTGLRLTHAGARRVVVCLSRRTALTDAFGEASERPLLEDVGGRLRPFGILDAGCQPDRIRHDMVDQLARTIHERYLRVRTERGDAQVDDPSMRPWRWLPDRLKRSNCGQAEHIGTKLWALRCAVVPATAEGTSFHYLPGEVDTLARMEHRRWIDEQLADGLIPGPERDGVHHPDLVEWEELSEVSKARDIDFVEHLSSLLADAGFAILRVGPPGGPVSPASPAPVRNAV